MDLYDASMEEEMKSSYTRSGNYGKKWTKEEDEWLQQAHLGGVGIKELAAQRGRV